MKRREFIINSSAAAISAGSAISKAEGPKDLAGKIGIVTASLAAHFSKEPAKGKITLLDLPQFMNSELGLEVVDFNTMNFPSYKPAYIAQLRENVEKTGCVATNLKMNQRVNMSSPDKEERGEALRVFKASIDAAALLGCRWVRPLPRSEKPDPALQKAAFDELIDYGAERNITVLIENFGWMMKDPDSVVNLVSAIGKDRVQVGVDTGNWSDNKIRYPALEKTYPLAVTCDFKAKKLGTEFEHPAYDLKRCFDIGWAAGFRGPLVFGARKS